MEALQTHHFDLQQGVVAVVEQVLGLATVDSNHSEQKLTTEPERHELNVLAHDRVCGCKVSVSPRFDSGRCTYQQIAQCLSAASGI